LLNSNIGWENKDREKVSKLLAGGHLPIHKGKQTMRIIATSFALIAATTLLGACSEKPASAEATNFSRWENSTGTRSSSGNQWVKGTSATVTDTTTLKLDGMKGDIHVYGGQVSGSAWFQDGNTADKLPGFGAGLYERQITVDTQRYGGDSSFSSHETFTAGSDEFTIR
jgi:hypothetical protein